MLHDYTIRPLNPNPETLNSKPEALNSKPNAPVEAAVSKICRARPAQIRLVGR